MAENDRDQQASTPGAPQQANNNADENPQQGAQWDNYQTRTLSTEGEPELKESDLLNADEAQNEKVQHRSDSE